MKLKKVKKMEFDFYTAFPEEIIKALLLRTDSPLDVNVISTFSSDVNHFGGPDVISCSISKKAYKDLMERFRGHNG